MIQVFQQNDVGRDFVVGDIHGCYTKLQARLDGVAFDETKDRLFSVGDLVDRGPESEASLEWVQKPWFHPVRGNHDEMVVRWPSGRMDVGNYAANGGAWMIAKLPQEYQPFADAFRELPLVIEVVTPTGKVGILHAECPIDDWEELKLKLDDKPLQNILMWGRHRIKGGEDFVVKNIDRIYVGHTPVKQKVIVGNHHYIDMGTCFPNGGDFHLEQIN